MGIQLKIKPNKDFHTHISVEYYTTLYNYYSITFLFVLQLMLLHMHQIVPKAAGMGREASTNGCSSVCTNYEGQVRSPVSATGSGLV